MKQPFQKIAVAVLLALLLNSTTAYADIVQGKIASTNTSGVNLAIYDDKGQPYPNLLKVSVGDPKLLSGIRTYDWVRADVKQNKNGSWQALTLKKVQTPKISTSGAPFAPTPQPTGNLMNALKTPQAQTLIRGSLMGAITGAISSGVSGGKAGKGALIGAGLGAATGLLQNIFNAPAPQQQAQGGPYVVQERPQHPSGSRIIRRYDADGHLVSEEEVR